MSPPGLMQTQALTPAHLRPHLGIPELAWDQSNPSPGILVVLPLLIRLPLEGAVGHHGGQTGTGAVHQSAGVAVADHPVGVVAHMDRPVGVADRTDHPAGEGVRPGVGVTPVKAAGAAGGLLVLEMAQAFQAIPEAGM